MLHITTLHIDDEIRFWSKVLRKGPDDCWNWIGGCTGNTESRRRPVFKIKDTNYIAARIAWVITHKQDPGEKLVCHTCTQPMDGRQLCVNPNHLYLGTHSDNRKDAYEKGEATNNRSKLLDHDKAVITDRYNRGESPTAIGLDYNLHRHSIWRIATGRTG